MPTEGADMFELGQETAFGHCSIQGLDAANKTIFRAVKC